MPRQFTESAVHEKTNQAVTGEARNTRKGAALSTQHRLVSLLRSTGLLRIFAALSTDLSFPFPSLGDTTLLATSSATHAGVPRLLDETDFDFVSHCAGVTLERGDGWGVLGCRRFQSGDRRLRSPDTGRDFSLRQT